MSESVARAIQSERDALRARVSELEGTARELLGALEGEWYPVRQRRSDGSLVSDYGGRARFNVVRHREPPYEHLKEKDSYTEEEATAAIAKLNGDRIAVACARARAALSPPPPAKPAAKESGQETDKKGTWEPGKAPPHTDKCAKGKWDHISRTTWGCTCGADGPGRAIGRDGGPPPPASQQAPKETAAEHFRMCGLMCPHIDFCADCLEVYGTCPKHRDDPDSGLRFKAPAPSFDANGGEVADE